MLSALLNRRQTFVHGNNIVVQLGVQPARLRQLG
jgi:hypothetical protein